VAKFIVDGNRRLQGEVDLQGAKNSALPIISATLLCSGESVIHCCPIISDIMNQYRFYGILVVVQNSATTHLLLIAKI